MCDAMAPLTKGTGSLSLAADSGLAYSKDAQLVWGGSGRVLLHHFKALMSGAALHHGVPLPQRYLLLQVPIAELTQPWPLPKAPAALPPRTANMYHHSRLYMGRVHKSRRCCRQFKSDEGSESDTPAAA